MATLQKTYSGDLSSAIAGQIWEARQDAAAKRREAKDIIGKEVDDDKLQRGEFMGHALLSRMTQMLPERFQHNMPDLKGSEYLMRGQQRQFASPINPKPTRASLAAKIAGQPFPNVAVGAPLKYQVKPQESKVAGKPNILGTRKDEVKVTDKKLGKFVSEVAISLSGSLNILNKRMDSIDEGIIVAKDGLSVTQEQLEDTGSVLEDKLDAIISLLRSQTEAIRKAEDRAEASQTSSTIAGEKDVAGTNEFVDSDEKDSVVKARNDADNDIDLSDRVGQGMPLPGGEAERGRGNTILHGKEQDLLTGKTYDGPDTGYLANTAGPIAPINNFFTRGQTGAASKTGGLPSGSPVEKGTKQNLTDIPEVKEETDKLAKAALLPIQAAGAMTMGVLGKALGGMGSVVGEVAGPLKAIATPIASMFGIKNSITNNLAEEQSSKSEEKKRAAETSAGTQVQATRGKKAWWDFMGLFTGGPGGGDGIRSGGSTSHRSTIGMRNTKHATSIGGARSTSSVRSTTSIGGSSNKRFNILNPFSWNQTMEEGQAAREGRRGTVLPSDGSSAGPLDNMLNRNDETQRMINELLGGGGAGFSGATLGNLGESAYGGTVDRRVTNNINNQVTSPASKNRFVNIDQASKDQALSRVDRANKKVDPVVINTTSAQGQPSPKEIEHIPNVGDPGLDLIYPSLV